MCVKWLCKVPRLVAGVAAPPAVLASCASLEQAACARTCRLLSHNSDSRFTLFKQALRKGCLAFGTVPCQLQVFRRGRWGQ